MVRKKITERFQIFDEKEADRIVEALKALGYEDDDDYYKQKIYRFEYSFEATGYATGLEDEEDDLGLDAWDDADYEDVIHTDRTVIGYAITNTGNESLDIDEIMKWVGNRKLRADCCVICGSKLAINTKYLRDRRKEDDGLKCFDHRGIRAERIIEKTELGLIERRKKQPLPIRNKPAPSPEPPAQKKPQPSLLKYIEQTPIKYTPTLSNENAYVR